MKNCPHCKVRPFETVVTGGARYTTLAPTLYHARLRASDARAYTMRYDLTVKWPFGSFATIVAKPREVASPRRSKSRR